MISHTHRFIFIHIPRTGGSSISRQLGKYSDQNTKKHWNASDYVEYLTQPVFDSYFKFTFIRNPWDIMVSKYVSDWYSRIGYLSGKSFSYFLDTFRVPNHEHGDTFFDYFSLDSLDFVGRYESRSDCLKQISKKINFDIDTNLVVGDRGVLLAKKQYRDYRIFYDDASRDFVYRKYKKELDTFKYSF